MFWGCDDETQPTGGGKARIICNYTPLIWNAPVYESAYLAVGGAILNTQGTNNSSSLSTDLFSVTKGQTVSVFFQLNANSCKSVQVAFELNGTVIETRNYSMGTIGGPSTGLMCSDGLQQTPLFIVP